MPWALVFIASIGAGFGQGDWISGDFIPGHFIPQASAQLLQEDPTVAPTFSQSSGAKFSGAKPSSPASASSPKSNQNTGSSSSYPSGAGLGEKENPYLISPQTSLESKNPSNASQSPSSGVEKKPVELKVVENRYLPPDMYGQWSVTATLVRTDLPEGLPSVVHDIWNLFSAGDQVYITNPTTGAEASISVDRVVGKTATFHHQVVIRPNRTILIEQPTVTVAGNLLTGETRHSFISLNKGQVVARYSAVFRIEAQRLNRDSARLSGLTRSSNREPTFEIEEIQSEPAAAKPAPKSRPLYP